MQQHIASPHTAIALNADKTVFRLSPDGILNKVSPAEWNAVEDVLARCDSIEYFRHPFQAILAAVSGRVIDEWKIHPNVFYPLTPLDYERAIENFASTGFAFPVRLITHITDFCNSECTICTYLNERRRVHPTYISGDAYLRALDHLDANSSILGHDISGGGDPSVHSKLSRILDYSGEHGIKTFLTTNGTFHPKAQERLLLSIARNVSVLTVSIKGLTNETYQALQRPKSRRVTLDRVLGNVDAIVKERDRAGRQHRLLIGVATVVHPENTGHYTRFIERLVDIGVDYVYVNPVEPNLETYGLSYTSGQLEATTAEIEALTAQLRDCSTYVRFPQVLFRQNGSVYIEARKRINTNVCLMPVLQPLLVPNPARKGSGKLVCCRYHKIRNNSEFQFTDRFGEQSFDEVWTKANLSRVTRATQQCTVCPCERQAMAFDWMLHIKQTRPEARFFLRFDPNGSGSGVHHFERVIETRYDRSSITREQVL